MPSDDCVLLAFVNPAAGFHRRRRSGAELKGISGSNLQAGMLFRDIPDMDTNLWVSSDTKAIIRDPVQTKGTAGSIPFSSCLGRQGIF